MSKAIESQQGQIHLLADAELDRFRVVCQGTDADHVAYPTAATTRPLGLLPEGCEAAEEAVAVRLMGYGETPVLKISGTLSAGDLICPAVDGTGKGRAVPASGPVYVFARALEDAADGQEIAIQTFAPFLYEAVASREIVVAKTGSDTQGNGTFAFPYATVTKAFSVWTALRPNIVVMPGDYEEAATLTWPNVTGLTLMAFVRGTVSISNADAATQVLLIAPTYTAATFEASVRNIGIDADTQIGIAIANAGMTKKLNVYLDGVTAEMDTSGDSVDIAGTVSGQAIRVYIKDCQFEGLVHFTVNDAGSRLRCRNSDFIGGVTTAGAVAAEIMLMACLILASGLTIGSATQVLTYRGSMYTDDSDPATYTELADGYSA